LRVTAPMTAIFAIPVVPKELLFILLFDLELCQ
jgi:hypothetical protein